MPYINTITQSFPAYSYMQSEILQFMERAFAIPESELGKVRAMYAKGGIDNRCSVLPDFNIQSNPVLFRGHSPNMQDRMEIYMQTSLPMCVAASEQLDLNNITHIITVSCTGMSAPGLDILLMRQLKLPASVVRTSVNFMGCYAMVHALKIANAFCATLPEAKVLIVAVELCTLHFQQDYSLENIATSMLFADGCVALIISNENTDNSLRIENFYSEVHSDSLSDMSWNITNNGFKMTLSAYVPSILADNIQPLLHQALLHANLSKEQIHHWAIHPGGKKIINEIAKALALSSEDTSISKKVLAENGNMSSVTLAVVLKEMMQIVKPDENIFACAFGPGLTMESLILKSCKA